jgi:hypothetical protein
MVELVTCLKTAFVNWLTFCLLIFLPQGLKAVVFAQSDTSSQSEFFESKVRPLLAGRCVECHGADEQSGDLRLDQKPAENRSEGAGPLVVSGQPGSSLLLRAVNYQDSSLQMPPEGKLTAEEIEILKVWVHNGAYWPEDNHAGSADQGSSQPPSRRIDEMRDSHWAFRSVQSPELPPVSRADWPKQPTDHFILAKLEQAGLQPSKQADRRTLIHRAYFTLVGLPPSFEEVEKFVADDSPTAFEQLVDRLLENQHYGERWARHWLDLARFAETTGYLAGSADTTYPYAYTYRDYVINALNDDKPFDRFIIEQLAADQLELPPDQQSSLAALGFLTVGRKFMNRVQDIIDDRIDVVSRSFLGLSVSCARCHDHKYDPIPIADYYSLYGVFASCHEPGELPLLGKPEATPGYEEFLAAQAAQQQQVDQWLEKKREATQDELRMRVSDYLVYLARVRPPADESKVEQKGTRGVLRPPAIQRWRDYLAAQAEQPHPVWTIWHQLLNLTPETFAIESAKLLEPSSTAQWISEVDPGLLRQLQTSPPQSIEAAAQVIGEYLEGIYSDWKAALKEDSSLTGLPDDQAQRLLTMMLDSQSPTTLDTAQILNHLDQAERNTYNRQLSKVKAVESTHPGAPGRAMVLLDSAQPHEPVVFLRGQPGNRGPEVPRRFLQVLEHVGGQKFTQGSGRLELAQAIASPKNPLTPRVIVNRIWQHHFGFGLVRTPSDFGSRGEPPTHPELLDYLAAEFMADGWSIKRLQRRIMLSATWQQSSDLVADDSMVDPENRLLWHMPRRRLDFEPLRDRLLVASAQLDSRIGGRSVKIHEEATRRALYAYVDREDVPNLLASFDVPSPDASQASRSRTTVPQQALYFMNSAFVIRQAQVLADQTAQAVSSADRITGLYQKILARKPTEEELQLAQSFAASALPSKASEENVETSQEQNDSANLDVWVQLIQVLLASNEFAFID